MGNYARHLKGEKKHEKNVPTQEKTTQQSARIPRKNEDHRRSQNACKTQKQGSSSTFSITGCNLEVYIQT